MVKGTIFPVQGGNDQGRPYSSTFLWQAYFTKTTRPSQLPEEISNQPSTRRKRKSPCQNERPEIVPSSATRSIVICLLRKCEPPVRWRTDVFLQGFVPLWTFWLRAWQRDSNRLLKNVQKKISRVLGWTSWKIGDQSLCQRRFTGPKLWRVIKATYPEGIFRAMVVVPNNISWESLLVLMWRDGKLFTWTNCLGVSILKS